jgi:hypothetical protein
MRFVVHGALSLSCPSRSAKGVDHNAIHSWHTRDLPAEKAAAIAFAIWMSIMEPYGSQMKNGRIRVALI